MLGRVLVQLLDAAGAGAVEDDCSLGNYGKLKRRLLPRRLRNADDCSLLEGFEVKEREEGGSSSGQGKERGPSLQT